ncbi:carbohydrate ABC transporter permease [Aquamicrobium sp. LC103]|uniref:carbohydrate ABC transporter permease n=1 Tax=Aquamicrobium sp. LC103 TaxID=1120658 RepID=UPI00063E98FF|nr:carbohydrate ABC transporter permease [Aquamicrobium sp. LC103]TKT79148.1 carbohydrate ABC transporter permease [Aquamicrobium sp. LC103]
MKRTRLQSLILYGVVVLTCAFLLFPVYWLIVTALSTSAELSRLPPSFWPEAPQWGTFAKVFAERPIPLWLLNSTLAALGSVSLSMVVSVLAGYSLSRFSVRGGHSLGLFILTAKMLPATLLVIPLFGIFRQVGLIGSLWSLVIAHATLIIPFTTWMLKGYFDTIPRELEQSAMVDGCSPLSAMVRVILPISTPGLAATALYAFVLSWSDYAYARTFLTNQQGSWTANLGITTMKGEYVTDWNEVSAAAIFIAVPIIVIYLFLERYLVGGLTAGAEK